MLPNALIPRVYPARDHHSSNRVSRWTRMATLASQMEDRIISDMESRTQIQSAILRGIKSETGIARATQLSYKTVRRCLIRLHVQSYLRKDGKV